MSQTTVNFFNTNNSGGIGGSVEVKQLTKMNVMAPHETIINTPFTNSFKRLPIEILKMQGGSLGVVETLCNFDNSDANDFRNNEFIRFSDVMKLETDYEIQATQTDDINIYEFNFGELYRFEKILEMK